jgi:metallophosphoesterase (TIGR00282 family)
MLKVIMVGDVVGDPGLEILESRLPGLIREHTADLVVVNGENAADGFGLTVEALKRILAAGADVVTGGNHTWEKRDFWPVLDSEERVLRPANYPEGTAGRGWIVLEKAPAAGGTPVRWLVVNLQGRELMTAIDCPFRCFDMVLKAQENHVSHALLAPEGTVPEPVAGTAPLVLVDFHAESTREKEALAWYLNGRASLVAGTHTHVQTADERILPGGTGYITDLGMTGAADSILGMDKKICLDRSRTQVLYRMECAKPGPGGEGAAISGIVAEIDEETRRTLSIKRIGGG